MQNYEITVALNKNQLEYILDGLYTSKEISNRNRSGHASSINPIIKMLEKKIKKAKKEIGEGQ